MALSKKQVQHDKMIDQEQNTLITLVSPSGRDEPPDELLVLLLLALGLRRLPFLRTFRREFMINTATSFQIEKSAEFEPNSQIF